MRKLFLAFMAALIVSNMLFAEPAKTRKKHTSPQIHEYVDLGLPSGTKWATMNVGADSVRGTGAFFAFGDVTPDYAVPGQKSGYARSFDWDNYKWSENGSLTKYCTNPMSGTVDGLKTLLPEDDAATAFWGSDWRTPTQHEYIELWTNCTHDTVRENGVFGIRLTSRVPGYEDRSIFFPYTGIREDDIWKGYDDKVVSAYMTANHEDKFGDYFSFPDMQEMILHVISRYIGVNVRAVYNQKAGCSPVDLGLNVLWATGNINATSFDERGDYFAWGSVVNPSSALWDTYPFGTMDNLTKYNTNPESGIVDNKTELEDVDEVAKALCGHGWRMPDTTDWQELATKCDWAWVDTFAVPGYMVTSKVPGYENARIFLPAVGFKEGIYINQPYTDFYYYTSHLSTTDPNKAISVYFSDITGLTIENDFRYYGFACRPVKDKQPTALPSMSSSTSTLNKFLYNGQLYIRKGDKTYNALGVER